jgi:PAS domain S-box-containing protein
MSDALASRSLADLLVQNVTDYAIYMLDPSGIVSSWNAGAARFKGYRADEIIGEHFSRFYTEQDRETGLPARALSVALAEGRFEAEGWRVRKDGSQVLGQRRHRPDPRRERAPCRFRQGHPRPDRAEARRRGARTLARAVLPVAEARGDRQADRRRGARFQQYPRAIMGSLGLAQRRMAQGEDVTRFLDNAIQAARRGATLTQRMLAFARKQELQLEPVDMIASVRGMAELLARTIGPQIAITTRFPLRVRRCCPTGCSSSWR